MSTPTPPAALRLLVVDDEAGYLDVLSKRLTKRGIEVTTVRSGDDGIQVLRKNDFDVAIVDLRMEGMDGIEVLEIFKKMDPDLAVIILTGHGSAQAAKEGIAKGAYDYLSKPCDLETLLKHINAAAGREPPETAH